MNGLKSGKLTVLIKLTFKNLATYTSYEGISDFYRYVEAFVWKQLGKTIEKTARNGIDRPH